MLKGLTVTLRFSAERISNNKGWFSICSFPAIRQDVKAVKMTDTRSSAQFEISLKQSSCQKYYLCIVSTEAD